MARKSMMVDAVRLTFVFENVDKKMLKKSWWDKIFANAVAEASCQCSKKETEMRDTFKAYRKRFYLMTPTEAHEGHKLSRYNEGCKICDTEKNKKR